MARILKKCGKVQIFYWEMTVNNETCFHEKCKLNPEQA
jgi:hypothetical protein